MSVENDLSKWVKKVVKPLKSVKKKDLEAMAHFAIDMIVTRTRLGYGVKVSGRKRAKLKKLAKSYTDFRKGKVAFATSKFGHVYPYKPDEVPNLHKFARPNRSNLSFTGKMLESMQVTKINTSRLQITVAPKGRRRGGGPTNQQIAEFNAENGRIFNNLSDLEIKKLARFYQNQIKKKFKKI